MTPDPPVEMKTNASLIASKDAQAIPLANVPTARWMSRGASDVVAMRSGWGANDTFVWMSCGDYFGAHLYARVDAPRGEPDRLFVARRFRGNPGAGD